MIDSTLSQKSAKQQQFDTHLAKIQAGSQAKFNSRFKLQQNEKLVCELTGYDELNPHGRNEWKRVSIHSFPDGVEVHINERYETWSEPDENAVQRPKGKRGEGAREDNKDRSARRAKTQVRRRCKAIQADCMLTLTYREVVTDEKRVQADLKALVKRLRTLGAFEYVATLELQKRGSLHVHLACQQFPAYLKNDHGVRVKSYDLIRSMWHRIIGKGNGNVDLTRPRGRNSAHRIASYIGKYVSKSISGAEFNAKSYWSSAGIVMPKPRRIVFGSEYSTWDIVSLVASDFFQKGLTDIAQYADVLGGFLWFSASRP
jgi:hypothetical protein